MDFLLYISNLGTFSKLGSGFEFISFVFYFFKFRLVEILNSTGAAFCGRFKPVSAYLNF
jgi:hypothetical protein